MPWLGIKPTTFQFTGHHPNQLRHTGQGISFFPNSTPYFLSYPLSPTHRRGVPQKWNFFVKNCIFNLPCLNFSHLQSTLCLMHDTYPDVFPTAQNSFWTRWFWCFLMLLWFFVSPFPHQQNVSLWGLFPSGETKARGEIGWIGRVGHGDDLFLVKNCWILREVWAGVLINHPSWNGRMCWKSFQKKFTEAKCSLSQQRQLVHWYRWVPRTLT